MSARQTTIDSHVVPFVMNPGDKVGKKIEVPKGWFQYDGAEPSDLDTLVTLTVTAWDADGTKWDSRAERRKGKKLANLARFIVQPSIVSDDDDPRGYPMRMTAYIAFKEKMKKRSAIAAEVAAERHRVALQNKDISKDATADTAVDGDGFDSAMEEAIGTTDEDQSKNTPSPKAKKKQKVVHEDTDSNDIMTPVAGVGLIRSPVWEHTVILSNGKVKVGKSEGKTWFRMQCKLCIKIIKAMKLAGIP